MQHQIWSQASANCTQIMLLCNDCLVDRFVRILYFFSALSHVSLLNTRAAFMLRRRRRCRHFKKVRSLEFISLQVSLWLSLVGPSRLPVLAEREQGGTTGHCVNPNLFTTCQALVSQLETLQRCCLGIFGLVYAKTEQRNSFCSGEWLRILSKIQSTASLWRRFLKHHEQTLSYLQGIQTCSRHCCAHYFDPVWFRVVYTPKTHYHI